MQEFALIRQYFQPLTRGFFGAEGLKDDAAYLPGPGGCDYVLTKDAIVAGVHFFPDDNPADIAKKLLRTNLSDLAAKAATPRYYMMSCVLPDTCSESWIAAFAASLQQEGDVWNLVLLGGDTVVHAGPLMLSVTMIGEVPAGFRLTRGGAKVGDGLWVTGTIGDGYAGLQVASGKVTTLGKDNACYVRDRYHVPTPRLECQSLLRTYAHAAMDISDGLVQDASHIAAASKCQCVVQLPLVPISDAAKEGIKQGVWTHAQLVTGGDDYELLFAVPKEAEEDFKREAETLKCGVRYIGEVLEKKGEELVVCIDKLGKKTEIPEMGYQHRIKD